jgi:broad specificity phosphatase PhoE
MFLFFCPFSVRSNMKCLLPLLLALLPWDVSSFSFSSKSVRSNVMLTRLYSSGKMDRRRFFKSTLISPFLFHAEKAHARGLVQFPCNEPLGNTYHFMRAGESLLDAEGIWSTNPLFITNRDARLSDIGSDQVRNAARLLEENNVEPTIVLYSLAASSMDSSNILGEELQIGRDRLVPEYYNLDPRAIGKWDTLPRSTTEPAVWAMDDAEADPHGLGGRPPPHIDSTPHETLANQATRLRQHMSLLETQYSGDTILLVFPDGTGPALLSCMIAGIPLNRVHQLEYMPGEVRLDVTKASTLALLRTRENSDASTEYKEILARGRNELERLRNMAPEDIINVKDLKLEKEWLEGEKAADRRELVRQERDEETRLARKDRARQVEQQAGQGNDNDKNGLPTVLLGVGVGVGTAGVLALATSPPHDAAAAEAAVNATPSLAELEDDVSVRTLISNKVNEEASVERVNGDGPATFAMPAPSVDKKYAAEQAMREYMESDDGGAEWLQVMVDLAHEEDEEELMP